MLNDWSDRMDERDAAAHQAREIEREVARRTARLEAELARAVARTDALPDGFYEAMGTFLRLRDSLFPQLSPDPAWKLLVTIAQTPSDSAKASVSGIAYGAGVPLTSALRYIAALEVQGVIERVPHPADKRQVLIRLTPDGRRRLDTLAERWATRAVWLCLLPLAALGVVLVA